MESIVLCIKCHEHPVYIARWSLCVRCYRARQREVRGIGVAKGTLSTVTMKKFDSEAEHDFTKNFFSHKNWQYHPAMFRLKDRMTYTPDFYDGVRNVFIEVIGTKQAYHQNKEKYDLFREIFPLIKLEIRQSDGSLLDETEGRKQWTVVSNG